MDRVADSMTLDLDPGRVSLLGKLARQKWLLWGAGPPVVTLAVVAAVLWFALSRSAPKPTEVDPQSATTIAAKANDDTTPKLSATQSQEDDHKEAVKPASAASASEALASNAKMPEPPSPSSSPTKSLASSTEPPRSVEDTPRELQTSSASVDKAAGGAMDDPQPADIKKAPPAQVDVAARLADAVAGIELADMPLTTALDLLSGMSAVPITLDPDALAQLGIAPRALISVHLKSVNMGKVLETTVAQRGLAVAVENGQLRVSSPPQFRETFNKVRYPVSDLAGEGKDAAVELATVVRKLVAPESWQGGGGRGTIEAEAGVLVVNQTGELQQQVSAFCDKLRLARQRPLPGGDDPRRPTLDTRLAQAQAMLDRPVTANFHQPAPLATVLAFLAAAAKCDILIDREAMATAETSDRVEASLVAQKEKLGAALKDLLRPLGLAYRAVGSETLQVTTKEAVEERLEVEFYHVGPWLAQGVAGTDLADRLKTEVAASTWNDASGSGDVCFDPPSKCLIVLQSQPVQAAIEKFLQTKGEGRDRKAE